MTGQRRMRPGSEHGRSQGQPGDRVRTRQAAIGNADAIFRAELPADLSSAGRARAAVRRALAVWGMDDPSGDAELLASELVANAAEHAGGSPISIALSRHAGPAGQRAITCEVTDGASRLPQPRDAGPEDERGRGLAIVTALAAASGVRAEPAGKTSWFTLALRDHQAAASRAARETQAELEAGA